jgi:hypothetical protein
MAETAVATAGAAGPRADAPLDEVMLAMDVVDTLRHADRLVERELGSDARDQHLKERLREIYRSQGIEVADRVLDEGVAALKEERFVYKPTPPGLARTLALAWVDRARWARWLLAGVAAVAVYQGIRWVAFDYPAQQKREAAERERVELPRTLAGELTQIKAIARDPEAVPVAERLVEEGVAAVKAGNLAAARAKFNELKSLRENLEQGYILQIVSGPNQKSGVYRIPAANPRARNYYVIVQAIGQDGKVLSFPVFSEEDNKLERVSRWGIRVDESVYNRIRDDKLDDGIIQNNRFGEKRKGYLKPDYAYPVQGGAILEW